MDNDWQGTGNMYDYRFRIYDPCLGRFLSIDPLFKTYPWYPPFHLHEFTKRSFEELSKQLNFKIVDSYYEVCSIYHIPKMFHGVLRKYMKMTNKGMQLTIYLIKN